MSAFTEHESVELIEACADQTEEIVALVAGRVERIDTRRRFPAGTRGAVIDADDGGGTVMVEVHPSEGEWELVDFPVDKLRAVSPA